MKQVLLNTIRKSSSNYAKYSTLIDDEDYKSVSEYRWRVLKIGTNFYACTEINGKFIYLHNFIMGDKGIDHIDGNGLNNQRSNLRKATKHQNAMNKRITTNTTSKYKGVYWHKKARKWSAQVMFNYKYQYIGLFENETDAGLAYNERAVKLFGEFAKLNTI